MTPGDEQPPEPTPSQATEDAATLGATIASVAAMQTSLTALAAGSIDRSRAGAAAVVTAASAIAAVYSGLLGYVFSIDESPLAARALLAPIFFAVAITLSTAYLAYITATKRTSTFESATGWASGIYERTNQFIGYTKRIVVRRVWMLQAAVVALGLGVVCIALPFIAPGATAAEPVEPSSPIVETWPTPPPSTGTPELDALLFQAQLDQAVKTAEARALATDAKNQIAADAAVETSWMDGIDFLLRVLLAGTVLIIVTPIITAIVGWRSSDT